MLRFIGSKEGATGGRSVRPVLDTPHGRVCVHGMKLNGLFSLSAYATATLATHQRAPWYRRDFGGCALSGVAILGSAVLSFWLAINIAIAVPSRMLVRRY
jgi:hypothetical protein